MIPVIFVCAISVDGRMTRHGGPDVHTWTSKEDASYFADLLRTQTAIIMGRKTYEAVRARIRPNETQEHYVITHTPERFETSCIPSQLEFANESPKILLDRLEKQGHKQALLAGGAALGRSFIEAGCVSELWITLEPKLFGSGHPLIAETMVDIQLELLEIKRANEQGTLFLRYRVCTSDLVKS